MPMTTIMHISFRCEHAKKTVLRNLSSVMQQLGMWLGYGHDGSKGSLLGASMPRMHTNV